MPLKELVSRGYKSISKIVSDIEVCMHIYFVNENKKAGIKLKHNQTRQAAYYPLSVTTLNLCYPYCFFVISYQKFVIFCLKLILVGKQGQFWGIF